jgi:hypothetical protein
MGRFIIALVTADLEATTSLARGKPTSVGVNDPDALVRAGTAGC